MSFYLWEKVPKGRMRVILNLIQNLLAQGRTIPGAYGDCRNICNGLTGEKLKAFGITGVFFHRRYGISIKAGSSVRKTLRKNFGSSLEINAISI